MDSQIVTKSEIITNSEAFLIPTKSKSLLGKGGYGRVIICPEGACKYFTSREIFFREAALSIYLDELPSIVRTINIDCINKMIKMDRYQSSFHVWIQKNPYIRGDGKDSIRIGFIFRILLGLNSLHQLGLLHGDIKPANILINNNLAVLADFGNTGSPLYVNLRYMTKFYSPPERETTLSADIYALGVTILEIWKPIRTWKSIGVLKSDGNKKLSIQSIRPDNSKLKEDIEYSNIPGRLKIMALLCVDLNIINRPTPKYMYNQLTGETLLCHLPNIPYKTSKYGINTEQLCEVMRKMREYARIFELKSPERTLGLFNYWVSIRKINPKDYDNYARAILYLYDQIIRTSASRNIVAYFGKDELSQIQGKNKVCQLLGEKRGLQILIRGF